MSAAEPRQTYHLRSSTAVLVLRLTIAQVVVVLLLFLLFLVTQAFPDSIGQVLGLAMPLLIFLIGLGDVGVIGLIFVEWLGNEYIIRPNEVEVRRGVLQTTENIYKLDFIEAVEVRQSIFGKMLGYGTVRFYSPVLEQTVELVNIPDPERFANLLGRGGRMRSAAPDPEGVLAKRKGESEAASETRRP